MFVPWIGDICPRVIAPLALALAVAGVATAGDEVGGLRIGDEATASPPEAETLPPQEAESLGPGTAPAAPTQGPSGARAALDPHVNEVLRVGGALAAVIVLILMARLFLRRVGGPLAGGGRPSGVLELLARYPVGRAQHLALLKLGGRVVLVHQSKSAITTIAQVTDPDEVAALLARVEAGGRSTPRRADGFPSVLGKLLGRDDEFPPVPGRGSAIESKVVIDLTRRRARKEVGA